MERRPLQVYLDERQFDALRGLAGRRKTSMADIVRESLALYLANLPLEDDPAMRIVGLGSSGLTDATENLDRYIEEHVMAKLGRSVQSETEEQDLGHIEKGEQS